jgi:hypothetical protein
MNASFRLFSLAVVLGLGLSGCLETTERGLTASPPAYTDPSQIEMLSAPPARAHQVLGEIQLETGDWRNEQVAETKIRTEAARLLADAVIVYGRSGPQRPVAIRYTGNTPTRSNFSTDRDRSSVGPTSTGGTGGSGIGSGGAFPDGGMTPGR